MKQITEIELKIILDNHKLWIDSGYNQGKHANLAGANLEDANLVDANLEGAIMPETKSTPTKLREELESVAAKHGMKIENITLQFR
jgi:uncharacterized protein YjbI with pentapeptide repeats